MQVGKPTSYAIKKFVDDTADMFEHQIEVVHLRDLPDFVNNKTQKKVQSLHPVVVLAETNTMEGHCLLYIPKHG